MLAGYGLWLRFPKPKALGRRMSVGPELKRSVLVFIFVIFFIFKRFFIDI